MYSNACRNASGSKPTTLHVMRYQGPTWEPWGPRTIVEEGVGLAAPVLHQFVILRRRTTDVAVGEGGSVMFWGFSPAAKAGRGGGTGSIRHLSPCGSCQCSQPVLKDWGLFMPSGTKRLRYDKASFFCLCGQPEFTFKWSLNTCGSVPMHYLRGCRQESCPEMGQYL